MFTVHHHTDGSEQGAGKRPAFLLKASHPGWDCLLAFVVTRVSFVLLSLKAGCQLAHSVVGKIWGDLQTSPLFIVLPENEK